MPPTTSSLALAEPSVGPTDSSLSLAETLGHEFADPALLELALRHRSWCAENGAVESNERLEFLGDSVLGVVVTEFLYLEEPDLAEGALAQQRSELVNARTLATVARELQIGPHILLGKGEASAGGDDKTSILSDALEAIFGAVFLDGGIDPATDVVLNALDRHLSEVLAGRGGDHKSRLQELAARAELLPRYEVSGEGPDHRRHFTANVSVGDLAQGAGEGRTKKQAEQAAAGAALAHMPDHLTDLDVGDHADVGSSNGADDA
jgi:ribonuclease-3